MARADRVARAKIASIKSRERPDQPAGEIPRLELENIVRSITDGALNDRITKIKGMVDGAASNTKGATNALKKQLDELTSQTEVQQALLTRLLRDVFQQVDTTGQSLARTVIDTNAVSDRTNGTLTRAIKSQAKDIEALQVLTTQIRNRIPREVDLSRVEGLLFALAEQPREVTARDITGEEWVFKVEREDFSDKISEVRATRVLN